MDRLTAKQLVGSGRQSATTAGAADSHRRRLRCAFSPDHSSNSVCRRWWGLRPPRARPLWSPRSRGNQRFHSAEVWKGIADAHSPSRVLRWTKSAGGHVARPCRSSWGCRAWCGWNGDPMRCRPREGRRNLELLPARGRALLRGGGVMPTAAPGTSVTIRKQSPRSRQDGYNG